MPEERSPTPRPALLRTRDLIGWTVSDTRGAKVGTVSELLLDRGGRVQMVAVDLGLFRRSILLPVEVLEWGEADIVLQGWSAEEARRLPGFDKDRPLTEPVAAELRRAHPRFYALDQAGSFPPRDAAKVVPLDQAKDFRLSKGAPDPRGWNVFGADGERAGVVKQLLVDPVGMRVAYLDVDVAEDLYLLQEDRHVAVPAERVDLRERGEDAWVEGLSAREIAELPAYTGGALDPLVEGRVRESFERGGRGRIGAPEGAPGVRVEEGGAAPPPLPPPPAEPRPETPPETRPDEEAAAPDVDETRYAPPPGEGAGGTGEEAPPR